MSSAYRYWAVFPAAVVAGLFLSGIPERANAFELFGFNLFGGSDDTAEVADPVRYSVALTSSNPELTDFLKEQSSLIADEGKPVEGDFGLAVKARDDRDRLIAALYEKGRYGAIVTIKVAGTPVESLPPSPSFERGAPVPVTIHVDPGPLFRLGAVHLEGDAAKLDPASYGLTAGGDAGSSLILSASEKIVTDLKAEGRPLAKLVDRQVVADHKTNTVAVTINAEGGPVAPIGDVTVEGASQVNPEFIAVWSNIRKGDAYTPQKLARAAKRLRELSAFSSVVVKEGDALDANGQIPIKIEVSEGKQRYFGAGVQVSTIDGLGLQGYWGHRNLFGNAESLKISGSVSRVGEASKVKDLDYAVGVTFAKPAAFGAATTLTANLGASITHPDAYSAKTLSGAVGVNYELNEQDTLSAGVALDWTQSKDVYGSNHYLTSSLPLGWVRDATDNKLDPTEGYRASVTLKPSYEYYNKVPFFSAEGSLSAYQRIGGEKGPVLAARLSAGTLVGGGNLAQIPATRRFYAGGGGSVRGYSYNAISPRNSNNEELGGRSYVTGSVEARFDVTDSIGLVPFIDVGTVSSNAMPDFKDIRAGAGIGLRYATPFGPLRLDFAVPLKRYPGGSAYGIYAGIGQAF